MEIRRKKVRGRNSWTEIGTATSEVTTPQLCGDGNMELQRCKLALLQHCRLATLQLASWQRCIAVTTRVVTMLWHCCSTRRCDTVAACAALARVATTAGRATLLCNDGRWLAPKFLCVFFFFYSTVSKKEREQDREKRDRASKPVSRLCWLA
jgi:hypothetical protein